MTKLYFRYGVMSSSKSLNCLAVAHNYETLQNKPVFLVKPSIDNRSGTDVESRAGLKRKADLIISPTDKNIIFYNVRNQTKRIYCVLVDEAQFLTEEQVYELTEIVDLLQIPVICYGLKTNFKNDFVGFEGAEALLRWSDKIEEIKTVCFNDSCNNKAMFNMRLDYGIPVLDGDEIIIGDIFEPFSSFNEPHTEYKPVCRKCYKNYFGKYLKYRNDLEEIAHQTWFKI